jgi:predicted MFS family arabinose efflux permease
MNTRSLVILFSVVFLDNLGFAIVLPYLLFYVQSLGGDVSIYGFLLTSYSLMSFIFTPIVSRISDRRGRRKILLYALGVSGFSYFVFGLANNLWLLFVARMIAGTTAASVPVAQAYAADISTKQTRIKYLGMLGAAAGLAFIFGPAIGGVLSQLFGYVIPSLLASAIAFSNLFLAFFYLHEPPRPDYDYDKSAFTLQALVDVLKNKGLRVILAIYFMFFLAFVSLNSVLSPWLAASFGFDALMIGLLLFYVGMVSAAAQGLFLPRLSKIWSTVTLVQFGIVLFLLSFIALGVTSNLLVLIVVSTVISIGLGILLASLSTLISLNAPKEAQGGTLGIAWSSAALAQTIAPTLATSLFNVGLSIGVNGLAFFVSALIALLIVPLLMIFERQNLD